MTTNPILSGLILLALGLAAGFAAGVVLAVTRRWGAGDDGATREVAADVEAHAAPLRDTLGRVETRLRELEHDRVDAYARLTEQVSLVHRTNDALRHETSSLVTALRAPQTRGLWGEMQLRRVVEAAGMSAHCDWVEQPVAHTPDGILRPDLLIRLAGGKQVVVDAKVPLAAYLTAAQTTDDDERTERLRAHARHLRTHVDQLAAKRYWAAFSPAPEFVVLFLPGEAFLAPALDHDPALLEDAMRARVVLATPTTLVALLRTVGYAWQQDALTQGAKELFDVGQELYRRLSTLGGHVDRIGRSLTTAVSSYNDAVGSLERRVLPQARRMADLGVVEGDLTGPRPVEDAVRPLTAPELVASELDAVQPRDPDLLDLAEDLNPAAPLRRLRGNG